MSISLSLCRGLLCLSAFITSPIFAQEGSESDLIESLTVVGQATNTTVTSEELETYQANDLADIFRLDPSISVGGSVGVAQKIYVRGLEDALINVTVDGAPQTSTLFHHIGRVTIDPALLQQVEVQAGAGEATSGAGAIGGAIRFETKDADDLLSADDNFGGNVKVSNFTNEGTQTSASLYGRLSDNWGALAYFNNIDRDNIKDGDGNEILGTSADQTLGFLKLSRQINDNQALSLSYESRDEEGQFSARPNWIVQPEDPLYDSQALRDTVVLNYSLQQSELINLEATAYQTDSSFEGGRFAWLAEISTSGLDLRNSSLLGNHKFTYGVDYRKDQVESGFADPQPEEDHAEEGSVLGVYAQGYSQLSDSLLLSYGLRYDDYQYNQQILLADYYGDPIPGSPASQESSEISFNTGFSYKITDHFTFGLGYAEASRGKEIGDGFTIDSYLFDASDASVVSPGLEAEKVTNIEASLEYSASNFNANFAIFSSDIDDAIFEPLYGDALFENIGTVKTDGFEFDFSYQWEDIQMSFGFSSTDTELNPDAGLYTTGFTTVPLNGYEFNGLANSRGDSLNLGISYTPTSKLSLGFNIAHVEGLTIDTLHQDFDLGFVPALYALEKPSYTTFDMFAEWAVTENLVVNLAATNLFDELYRDHSSVGDFSGVEGYELVVGPWEAGRDIRLSVSFNF